MIQCNRVPVSHLKPVWVFAPNFCKIRFPPIWAFVYSLQLCRSIGFDDANDVLWKTAAFCVRSLRPSLRPDVRLKASTSIWLRSRPSPLLGRLEMFLNSHFTLTGSKISVTGCSGFVLIYICKCDSLAFLLRSCFSLIWMRHLTFIQ